MGYVPDSEFDDTAAAFLVATGFVNQFFDEKPEPVEELSYEERVRALEDEGICRSDAQAIVDAEDLLADE